jgi:hypothetical protein
MATDTGKYFDREEVFGDPIKVQYNYKDSEQEMIVVELGTLRNGNHKVSMSRYVSNERTGYAGISKARGFMFDDMDELQNLVDALQTAIDFSRPVLATDRNNGSAPASAHGGGIPQPTQTLNPAGVARAKARKAQP